MVDLVVTSIAVDEAARQLKRIQDEFESADRNKEDRQDIWGHQSVQDAMSDFVSDWWVKRAKLLENIKDLQSKTQKAAETWGDTEIELVKSLAPKEG